MKAADVRLDQLVYVPGRGGKPRPMTVTSVLHLDQGLVRLRSATARTSETWHIKWLSEAPEDAKWRSL